VPVPFPSEAETDLNPPGAEEVAFISRGLAWAAAPSGGMSPTQRMLFEAAVPAMTGFPAATEVAPVGPEEFAIGLARRNRAFRTRILQLMILLGLTLRPLPQEVVDRIESFADVLGIDEDMLNITREFAAGTLGLAAVDFDRSGYIAEWHPDDTAALHTSGVLSGAWELAVRDPALAARWASLEHLPEGTLGRAVTEMYRARGFVYPGKPGSAPPLLAQHDWVHVLAEYGTTVESELEVFAFIARANDDPHAFSLLAMVVSLFETGYLRAGAGLFEYSPGHLSKTGVAVRVADAMRRGAVCPGSIDFLRTDWFEVADLPVDEARRRFGIPAKAPEAVASGSVGPWEQGGITPYQLDAGRRLAEAEGRPYDTFGAAVAADQTQGV
jgi:hypothetical protein